MKNEVPINGLEWTNLCLGACFACTAFMFGGLPVAAWNAGIVGALVMCCSAVALYRYADWTEWTNLTIGCWAVMAPFLLGFGSEQTPKWTHIIFGLCIAAIAAIQLFVSFGSRPPAHSKSNSPH